MELMQGYKQTELGIIPTEWDVKLLIEIAEIATGTTPPTRDKNNYGEDFLFVSPADLGKGKYIDNTEKKLSKLGFSLARKYPANSILFTCIGSTIGKAGISKVELSSNQQINAVFPCESYSSDFLYYYLNFISPKIKLGASEQAVPMINKTEFGKTQIVFPLLPEQNAIANALSGMDALISQTEKLIEKKKAIKQGAMQELLKPKDGWVTKKLGDVCEIKKGQLITESTRVNGNIPVIAGGKSPAYYHNKANRLGKTITISGSGASAGYVALHTQPIFASDCSTISESKNYKLEFIFYWLQLNQFKIYKMQTGGAQPHIHPSDLNPLEFNLPPIEQQNEIADTLYCADLEISFLELKLNKLKQQKQGMMQALLTGKIRLVS